MIVTPVGITTASMLEQLLNAYVPIEVTLFGILTFLSLEQSLNADAPIDVTFGMLMLSRAEILANAKSPIFWQALSSSNTTVFIFGEIKLYIRFYFYETSKF